VRRLASLLRRPRGPQVQRVPEGYVTAGFCQSRFVPAAPGEPVFGTWEPSDDDPGSPEAGVPHLERSRVLVA